MRDQIARLFNGKSLESRPPTSDNRVSRRAVPEAAPAVRAALAAGGARLIDFTFERHGLTRG